MIDVDAIIKKFEETMPDDSHERLSNIQSSDLKIIQDPEYKRFGSTIDLKMAYDLVGTDVEHLRFVLNELNTISKPQSSYHVDVTFITLMFI